MKRPLATLLLILLFAAPARAAQCGGDFNVFLSANHFRDDCINASALTKCDVYGPVFSVAPERGCLAVSVARFLSR
jgi:hypothetical protein